MAMFFNPVPLDGATFVENPAKTFVGRVARAIEYDSNLNAAYRSGKFFDDKANLELAIASAIDHHRTTGKQVRKGKSALIWKYKKDGKALPTGENWFKVADAMSPEALAAIQEREAARASRVSSEGYREAAEAGTVMNNPAPGLARVTPTFKRALAYAMGRGKGYDNAVARNRSRYLAAWAAQGVPVNIDRHGNATVKLRIKDKKGGVSVKNVKPEEAMKYLNKQDMIRGPGQRSLNAYKNELLLELPKNSTLEQRAELRAKVLAENQKALAARPKIGGKDASPDAIAQAMVARFPKEGIDRYYSPIPQTFRKPRVSAADKAARASAKEAARIAAEAKKTVSYVNAKGKTIKVSPEDAARYTAMKRGGGAKNNPFYEGDDFGSLALSNPSGIGFLDNVEDMVSRVPVVGESLAAVVAPAAGAAAAGAALYMIVPMVQDKLPDMLQPYAYATTGTAIGAACALAASSTSGDIRSALLLVGGAATTLGIGIDVVKRFTGGSIGSLALSGSEMGDVGDTGSLALSGLGDTGSLALSGFGDTGSLALSGLGDGGAYQVQSLGSLGFSADHGALSSMYADACNADAYFSGPDLDGVEGEAALAGATAYMGAFGAAPVRAAGPKRAQSRHAGLRGHRWGWLIKAVGFENFQKISELPPEQRMQVIKQLREQAMASVASLVDQAKAGAAAAQPVTAPAALSGHDPYGAALFSGSAY